LLVIFSSPLNFLLAPGASLQTILKNLTIGY